MRRVYVADRVQGNCWFDEKGTGFLMTGRGIYLKKGDRVEIESNQYGEYTSIVVNGVEKLRQGDR